MIQKQENEVKLLKQLISGEVQLESILETLHTYIEGTLLFSEETPTTEAHRREINRLNRIKDLIEASICISNESSNL